MNIAIIGGGFFGTSIAIHLAKTYPNWKVTVLESEDKILARASQKNQARVHRGYHYPRSFTTARSSSANYPRFCNEYSEAIIQRKSLYGIAKQSMVDANHFFTIYKRMGVPIKQASKNELDYFNLSNITQVFEVDEGVFNFESLRAIISQQIAELGIDLKVNCAVTDLHDRKSKVEIEYKQGGFNGEMKVDKVFNCTYSVINQFKKSSNNSFQFQHQVTEVALVELPNHLTELAITIMDGPFFSTLPFPSRSLHSLTHVTFTPHFTIDESELAYLYPKLEDPKYESHFDWMIASAKNYVPSLVDARYVASNFEIKSTLRSSGISDSRPIFVSCDKDRRVINVFGAKLDNIYDVLQYIDEKVVVAAL